jgi:hypothetical protein
MLHMQHALVVDLIVRQHEAARLKARRDAAAKARRTATARETVPERVPARRAPQVQRPRPA